MRPGLAIIGLWVLWAISWLMAAGWAAKTQKTAAALSQLGFHALLLLGALLLGVPAHGYSGPLRLWQLSWAEAWLCVGFLALGIALAWWARVALGRFWSGRITRKADHRVIDTGPYAFVRHPIYAGLLLAVYATAGAKGTVWGVGGALVVTLGLVLKGRLEEQWLTQELGEPYRTYRSRVPMLLPWRRVRRPAAELR